MAHQVARKSRNPFEEPVKDADRRQLRIKRQQTCQAVAMAWGEYPQSQGLNEEMADLR